jgi:pimeloyl-ACP methyl ester carboxylesterase
MTSDTSVTALMRFVEEDGIRFAYRRWGKSGGVPLVFLNYFSGNLDDWDPRVTDGVAGDYDVILFDNAGVGSSGGETPGTISEMTRHAVAFCDALELKRVNAVGFSLGGMIAQQLALDYPDRFNRIVLLGTGPRGGEGMTFTELSSEERADPEQFLIAAFFSPTDASQAAGRAYLKRLAARTTDRDRPVSPRAAEAQLAGHELRTSKCIRRASDEGDRASLNFFGPKGSPGNEFRAVFRAEKGHGGACTRYQRGVLGTAPDEAGSHLCGSRLTTMVADLPRQQGINQSRPSRVCTKSHCRRSAVELRATEP